MVEGVRVSLKVVTQAHIYGALWWHVQPEALRWARNKPFSSATHARTCTSMCAHTHTHTHTHTQKVQSGRHQRVNPFVRYDQSILAAVFCVITHIPFTFSMYMKLFSIHTVTKQRQWSHCFSTYWSGWRIVVRNWEKSWNLEEKWSQAWYGQMFYLWSSIFYATWYPDRNRAYQAHRSAKDFHLSLVISEQIHV